MMIRDFLFRRSYTRFAAWFVLPAFTVLCLHGMFLAGVLVLIAGVFADIIGEG